MLENLFAENGGGGDATNYCSSSSTTQKSVEKPPLPRNQTNLAGLYNQGATCYLNALIQTLCFTPEFRENLFRLSAEDLNFVPLSSTAAITTTNQNLSPKVRKIPVELQRLFAKLLLLNEQACSSTKLTDSFGWTAENAVLTFQHQDIHECNKIVFQAIEDSLIRTKEGDLIKNLYRGTTVNCTQCKKCKSTHKVSEDYYDLPIIVQGCSNLEQSLANTFQFSEDLTGDNQYRCSTCQSLCDAEKTCKIRRLPPILTLSLQRFTWDLKTGKRIKKTTRYDFPFEIDLKSYCEDTLKDTNYELFAVAIHKGTPYSGHYYAYIKDIDHIGAWTRPLNKQAPKERITRSTASAKKASGIIVIDPVQESNEEEKRMMIETIKTIISSICDKNNPFAKTNAILETLKANTDNSWRSNRSNRKYGTFLKFLRDHPKIFELTSDNQSVRIRHEAIDEDVMDVDEPLNNGDDDDNQMDTTTPVDDQNEDEHWFCFDDSSVTCVTKQMIEKHFTQNECAYMLFYRNMNLRRKSTKISDNHHHQTNGISQCFIPQWLVDEIDELNRVLAKQREVYENIQNQFLTTIYPGEWFQVIEGRLNVNNQESILPAPFGEHTLDKRQNVNDFMLTLEGLFGQSCTFYVAKKLKSGQFHGISELSVCVNDTTLGKTDLYTYRNIIVFEKVDMLKSVLFGEDYEPIMLKVVFALSDEQPSTSLKKDFLRYIPKCVTIKELKQQLFNEYYQIGNDSLSSPKTNEKQQQTLRQIRLGKLNLEEKNERRKFREFKEAEESHTIWDIGLRDNDTIGIDNRQTFTQSKWKDAALSTNTTSKLCLTIRNAYDDKKMTQTYASNTSIGEVKLVAVSAFGLSINIDECRLHLDDDTDEALLPLYDNQTVDQINFRNETNLCLKPGQALYEEDFLLFIQSDFEPSPLEIVVNQNIKLNELIKRIKMKLRINPEDDYYLCTSTWCNDEGDKLNDFEQSLQTNNLKHGSRLQLVAGSIPPKNHVRLKLSRIIRKYTTPKAAIHTKPFYELEAIDGNFELPNTAQFHVLRERIATMLHDTKACERIRLYEIGEDGQPKSIIHEPTAVTLKQKKVSDLDSSAFEILPHAENLGKKDLLINLVYSKVDDNNQYFEHLLELHWPLKENIIAKYEYLYDHVQRKIISYIRNNLQYSPVISRQSSANNNSNDRNLKLTLARYFPDTAKWKIIDPPISTNPNQNKKGGSGKGSTTVQVNLRNQPISITDLCTIGVLEGEKLTIADFETAYDRDKQKQIELDQDKKRTQRSQNRADNDLNNNTSNNSDGTSKRGRSPQRALKIEVDDFYSVP